MIDWLRRPTTLCRHCARLLALCRLDPQRAGERVTKLLCMPWAKDACWMSKHRDPAGHMLHEQRYVSLVLRLESCMLQVHNAPARIAVTGLATAGNISITILAVVCLLVMTTLAW